MTYQSQTNAFGLTGLSASGLNPDYARGMQVSQSSHNIGYTTRHNDVSYQSEMTMPMIKSKVAELIEYLRLNHRFQQSSPATHTDIFKAIHIDVCANESKQFVAECVKHPKLMVENADAGRPQQYFFYYKPYYPYHKTRKALYQLIEQHPMGVKTDQLLDSYLEAGADLEQLYDDNMIIILVGNKKDQFRAAPADSDVVTAMDSAAAASNTLGSHSEYVKQLLRSSKNISYLDSRCYIRQHSDIILDKELKQLYHSIKLPSDPAALELALADAGYVDINKIKAGYVDKTRKRALTNKHREHLQDEEKKKRKAAEKALKKGSGFRKNVKLTNEHLINSLTWLKSAVNGS